MKNSSIYVIVPAYNEEKVIGSVIKQLLQERYSVVVVDDGSSDQTLKRIKEFRITLKRHLRNKGQGAALKTGIREALKHNPKAIVLFDADGQHQVADIQRLIQPIIKNKADIVFGSRFLRKKDTDNVPFIRQFILKGGALINGFLSGIYLSDAHNGLRSLSKKAAQKINLTSNRASHASEILFEAAINDLKIKEVPTSVLYTAYSKSKGRFLFFRALLIFIEIVQIRWKKVL